MNFIDRLLENLRNKRFTRDDIWGVDLADMQSLSKYKKGAKCFLCPIDLFSKYAWTVPLKDKKGITIVNAFQKNNLQRTQTK